MGKSKKVKKSDISFLKMFVSRRRAAKIATIVSAVLFFMTCVIIGPIRPDLKWIIFGALALYIVCFIWLRTASNCPYCGRAIMTKFDKRSHCPYCHRPIKPNAPARDSMAGK